MRCKLWPWGHCRTLERVCFSSEICSWEWLSIRAGSLKGWRGRAGCVLDRIGSLREYQQGQRSLQMALLVLLALGRASGSSKLPWSAGEAPRRSDGGVRAARRAGRADGSGRPCSLAWIAAVGSSRPWSRCSAIIRHWLRGHGLLLSNLPEQTMVAMTIARRSAAPGYGLAACGAAGMGAAVRVLWV